MSEPGIKLHERTLPMQRARLELSSWLLDWEQRHSVTAGEAISALSHEIAMHAKYLIRQERHGDTSKKGDEA